MSGKFWWEECTKWVEASEVHETSEVVHEDRGDKRTVYEHELCGMEVTPDSEY